MASTITFRPKPGIVEALDALDGDRSSHINAALAAYLNGDTAEPVEPTTPAKPRRERKRPARQAVPTPVGERPECPHPKAAIKTLQYGKQCTECGQMIR